MSPTNQPGGYLGNRPWHPCGDNTGMNGHSLSDTEAHIKLMENLVNADGLALLGAHYTDKNSSGAYNCCLGESNLFSWRSSFSSWYDEDISDILIIP